MLYRILEIHPLVGDKPINNTSIHPYGILYNMNPYSYLRTQPYSYYPISQSALKSATLGQTNTPPLEVFLALSKNKTTSFVESIIYDSLYDSYSRLNKYNIPNPFASLDSLRNSLPRITLWGYFEKAYNIYVEVDRMVLKRRFASSFDYSKKFATRRDLMIYLCGLWELEKSTAYAFYTALHINNATARDWLAGKEYAREFLIGVVLEECGIDVERILWNDTPEN